MTLNETVRQKVAEWRPAGPGRYTLAVPHEDSGWAVALTADRNDELGCLVWELALRRLRPAADDASLQAWADRSVARVTSLLEPLAVHEVDRQRDEALLRTETPSMRGDTVLFFQVLLQGTRAAELRRYQAGCAGAAPRTQVCFPLTHEALAKFVADLADA